MKKIVLFVAIAAFLSSCSMVKLNDFSARKYTHNKKAYAESAVKLEKEVKEEVVLVNEEKVETAQSIEITNEVQAEAHVAKMENSSKGEITSISNENTSVSAERKVVQVSEDKRELRKENKREAKIIKRTKKLQNKMQYLSADANLLLVIIAILIPPLAVFMVDGLGTNFWIDLLLCCFFWLPGIIYALVMVMQ